MILSMSSRSKWVSGLEAAGAEARGTNRKAGIWLSCTAPGARSYWLFIGQLTWALYTQMPSHPTPPSPLLSLHLSLSLPPSFSRLDCPSGCGVPAVYGTPSPHAVAPHTSSSSSSSAAVVLVGLGLALGALRFGVGGVGRVGLLHGHGAPQVWPFAQEVGLGRAAQRAFAQHQTHRRALLGPCPVPELERGEVHGVPLAQAQTHRQAQTDTDTDTHTGTHIRIHRSTHPQLLTGTGFSTRNSWTAWAQKAVGTIGGAH